MAMSQSNEPIPDLNLEPRERINDAAVDDALARDAHDFSARRFLPDGSIQELDDTGAVVRVIPAR